MSKAGGQDSSGATTPTRIAPLDHSLPGGGLALGMTHEWYLDTPLPRGDWLPPTLLLTWLASGCHRPSSGGAGSLTIWIGRRTWPSPWTLAKAGLPLSHCLFINPRDEGERLWAIDLCLRCHAAAAVIADASGLDMGSSRRLQLAAESGGTLGLLARPPWEVKDLSAAATRWLVTPQPGPTVQWKVELRRCKAGSLWSKASHGAVREWTLAWRESRAATVRERINTGSGWVEAVCDNGKETNRVRVAPDVASGPGAATARRTA